MRELLRQQESARAIHELHMLKGAAATLGAEALARAAAEAEAALRAGADPALIDALLLHLRACLVEAVQVFGTWESGSRPTRSP